MPPPSPPFSSKHWENCYANWVFTLFWIYLHKKQQQQVQSCLRFDILNVYKIQSCSIGWQSRSIALFVCLKIWLHSLPSPTWLDWIMIEWTSKYYISSWLAYAACLCRFLFSYVFFCSFSACVDVCVFMQNLCFFSLCSLRFVLL